MSDPEKPSVLERLDEGNARRAGVQGDKIWPSNLEGYAKWPMWQKAVATVLVLAAWAAWLWFRLLPH